MLSASSEHKVNCLLAQLNELNGIVLKLQLKACSLQKAKAYCEIALESYPLFDAQLINGAKIVQSLSLGLVLLTSRIKGKHMCP